MDQTGWLWVLSGSCSLLIAFGGFVVKRIVHELDHQRTKQAEIFSLMTNIRVEAAQAKADNGKQFVTREDFREFKAEIFERFDKTDNNIEKFLITMTNKKENK